MSARARRLLSSAAAWTVLASVVAAGGAAAARRVSAALRAPQEILFPADLEAALPDARRLIPPDAPVLYVGSDPNTWRCGLWQRALYPRPLFCLRPAASSRIELPQIRRSFAIRYAIGSAPPPPEIRLARRRDLTDAVWIGELAP